MEFARRLLGERYEVVVATHLDHEHFHCHIVFNSVSFVDGRRHRSDFTSYYRDIRGISNEISRERGLSEIQPKGRGKHYAEWNAERKGKPTIRSLVREDIDAALEKAFTYREFLQQMRALGYTVKAGENVKHTALKPPGGKRLLRLDSLGEEYSEQAIKQRLGRRRGRPDGDTKGIVLPVSRRYTVKHRRQSKRSMPRGLQQRYLYFLFLFSPQGKQRKQPFPVRAEVRRLERYIGQYYLLRCYRIESLTELSWLQDALQTEIDALVAERAKLYRVRRKDPSPMCDEKIASLNDRLRQLRRERNLCWQIEESLPLIQTAARQAQEANDEKELRKERDERRNSLWK